MEFIEIVATSQVSKTLPLEEILIMPIGDSQLGVPASDEDKLQRHVDWGISQGAYFINMGDSVDMSSPSNRQRLRHTDFYDGEVRTLHQKAEQDVERYYEIMKATKGRWLGWVRGHHFTDFGDGTTSDTRLCQLLEAPFLGDTALIRLQFEDSKGWTAPVTGDILAYHGSGAGKRLAAPLNLLEQVAGWFNADIYLTGHHHKKVAGKLDYLFFDDKGKLKHKTKTLACTGSFLKGYLQGSFNPETKLPEGTYVEKGMLPPVTLGGVVIRIRPESIGGVSRLDVNVEI